MSIFSVGAMPARHPKARLLCRVRGHTERPGPFTVVAGRFKLRLTRECGDCSSPQRWSSIPSSRVHLPDPVRSLPTLARESAPCRSTPVVSLDTVTEPEMTPILPRELCFAFFGPSLTVVKRFNFLQVVQCAATSVLSESHYRKHRRKTTGDPFLVLRVRKKSDIIKIWQSGLTPWLSAVNVCLAKKSCRLATQSVLPWMQFAPGATRNVTADTEAASPTPLILFNPFDALCDGNSEMVQASEAFGFAEPDATVPMWQGTVAGDAVGSTAGQVSCSSTFGLNTGPFAEPARSPVNRGTVHVGNWNVRGLKVASNPNKAVDLCLVIAGKGIQVCAVQETWMNPNQDLVATPGFHFMGEDAYETGTRLGGGTGFLIKDEFIGCATQLRWKGKQYPQASWIKLKSPRKADTVIIASVYMRPVSDTRSISDMAADLAAFANDLAHWQDKATVLVCGDFNARIGRRGASGGMNQVVPEFGEGNCDAAGANLILMMEENGLFSLANRTSGKGTQFTCKRTQGQSVVDYIMGPPNFLKYHKSMAHFDVDDDSDHLLMRVTIPGHIAKRNTRNTASVSWRLELLNNDESAEAYRFALAKEMLSVTTVVNSMGTAPGITQETVDRAFNLMSSGIHRAASATIGVKISRGKNTAAWWSPEYATIRLSCQEAYENALRSKSKDAWAHFLALRKTKNKEMKKLKRQLFDRDSRKTSDLWKSEYGSKAAWNAAKQLRNTRSGSVRNSSTSCCDSVIDTLGLVVTEPAEIREVFRKHYETLASPSLEPSFDSQNLAKVSEKVCKWEMDHRHATQHGIDAAFTMQEISTAIDALPTYKAADANGIKSELIRGGGSAIQSALLLLFNWAWQHELMPSDWSSGIVVNIFKAGSTQDPNNYRGITLISVLRKMFSTMIRHRLQKHVPLHEGQAAFRQNRGCSDQLFTLTRIIQEAKKSNVPVFAFFLDIRKAYDTVWRDGLFYKLLEKGISGKLWRVLRDLFGKTTSRVRSNGGMSEPFSLSVGVGQGDPLSTFLFDIFLDDLLDDLHKCLPGDAVSVGDAHIAGLAYADDVNTISLNPEGLQNHMHCVGDWLNKWRMQGNFAKSKVVVFNPPPDHGAFEFTLNGVAIQQVSSMKYLGVVFQENGGWDIQAKTALNKMSAAVGYWRPLLNCSTIPTKVRIMMLHTFIYSAGMYGTEVWDTTKVTKDKMAVLVKKAIRCILGLHKMECSSDALFGDIGHLTPACMMDVAKICWHHKCVSSKPTRWIKQALACKFPGNGTAGRPLAGSDWSAHVHTVMNDACRVLNISDFLKPAADQIAVRRKSKRSKIVKGPTPFKALDPTLIAWQTWTPDTTMVTQGSPADLDAQDVSGAQIEPLSETGVGLVRSVVMNNMWLTNATLLVAEYAKCPHGKPRWYPFCLMQQGRRMAEYLDCLPSHIARFITSARSGKLCAMDLSLEYKLEGSISRTFNCQHCGQPQGDSMEAAVHCALLCAEIQPAVGRFKLETSSMPLNWDQSPELVLQSILSPEWPENRDRAAVIRYWILVADLFRKGKLCRSEDEFLEDDEAGHEDPRPNSLSLGALQVYSSSQGSPGVVNVHTDTADM